MQRRVLLFAPLHAISPESRGNRASVNCSRRLEAEKYLQGGQIQRNIKRRFVSLET